jgi:hypothetical protein
MHGGARLDRAHGLEEDLAHGGVGGIHGRMVGRGARDTTARRLPPTS